jgi:DNA-binding NarL/FixJ family response regulator
MDLLYAFDLYYICFQVTDLHYMNLNEVKIIITDPQYLTNKALEIILGYKYNVTGIFSSKIDLLNHLESKSASLLILDLSVLDPDYIADIKKIRMQVSNILIITSSLNQLEFESLTEAGIENIILKSADDFELFQAVDATLMGKKYYSETILEMLIEKSHKKNYTSDAGQLTTTEKEIVKLISDGLNTKQIASQKFISVHTVITHKKNIFRKTGVNSISELIMYAIKAGWINNIEYYI